MAEQVPTNGFAVPPLPAGQPLQPGPAQQPQQPQPQVPQAPQPVQQPAPQAPAAPADANADLLNLLQGFLATQQPATPAPVAPAIQGDFDPSEVREVTSDDPYAASMLSVLTASAPGLDVERLLGRALLANDAALMDVAYLQDKYPAQAQNILNIARGLVEHNKVQGARREAAVHTAAGGKANWDAAAAVFKQQAPSTLRQIAQVLFEQGNDEAGAKLVTMFAQQQGVVPQAGDFIQGGGGQSVTQALDKAGFQAELRKLNPQEAGFEQARDALFQRRHLGKQLGR